MKLPSLVADAALEPKSLEESSHLVWDWTDPAGAVVGAAGRCGEVRWLRLDGLATFAFEPGARSVRALTSAAVSFERLQDVFERGVLPHVIQVGGVEVLHASAVKLRSGVLAVCGDSGAGKSTLVAALSKRGFPLFADDAVAVTLQAERVMACNLPFRIRLGEDVTAYIGDLKATGSDDEPGSQRPLLGIVVLEPTAAGGRSGPLTGISPADAYPLILSQAYCFDPGDKEARRRTAESYLALVARVPVVHGRRSNRFEDLPVFAEQVVDWGGLIDSAL